MADTPQFWSQLLVIAGGAAMAVGALDPLEGSLVILPGSGLVLLGSYLGRADHQVIGYRLSGFVLIAVGVGIMWYVSSLGGFGGTSGRLHWWGVAAFLPYFVGWSAIMWGVGSPRWLCVLGLAVGLVHLAMSVLLMRHSGPTMGWLSAIGLVTIAGCAYRLFH